MRLELSPKQFRRLLDMVYIGNWILNSTRSEDRITDYDEVESLVFAHCEKEGLTALYERMGDEIIPSRAFSEGGIHEAVMDYEDTVFFEILAEELARRDMQEASVDQDDVDELNERITAYIAEFERNGTDNISLNL
ncbi:MAG: hypothetical protein LBH86_05175 [Oscillospiraceae bacterium]|jgi:hypothetical protein|nr:hypothetical protein [Oscillospiraceae bacterium]